VLWGFGSLFVFCGVLGKWCVLGVCEFEVSGFDMIQNFDVCGLC